MADEARDMRPEEKELLEKVAAALRRGQMREPTVEEMASAYQQVHAAKVAGLAVAMLEDGELDLALREDGEIQYCLAGPGDAPPLSLG